MEHTMNHATNHGLELRVLDGRQGGARTPLEAGVGCVLATSPDGFADGADIVLREEGVQAVRVRVTPGLPDATLEIVEGEVQLEGETLRAGAEASWSMRTPLRVGDSVVAFGPAAEADWNAKDDADTDVVDLHPTITSLNAPAVRRRARPELWLAAIGGLAALVCVGALWLGRTPAPELVAAVEPAEQLTEALRSSEFSALNVTRDALGRVALTGRLDTLVERSRLDAWLAERQLSPAISVHVDEAVARDVTEVFRINQVAVQAKIVGPGRIAAEAAEPDTNRLVRAEEVVRRDVRGLVSLTVQNRATPTPPPAPPVIDDPNKRIASVVAGSPAYIVTVDGARYFEGALLPTGHRIAAIAAQKVTVERDGHSTTLNF